MRKKPLSLIIKHTRRVLLGLVGTATLGLFVFYLFLANNLATQGLLLNHEEERQATLLQQDQHLETRIAQAETKKFIGKSAEKIVSTEPIFYKILVQVSTGHLTAYNIFPGFSLEK